MKALVLATIIFIFSVHSPLKEPPDKILKAFKQKFPSAMNIIWTEEENKTNVTANIMGKIYKYVDDKENTWKAYFLLRDRKTSATFDLEGHWLNTQQEIKLEDIGVDEVRAAIKKDYYNCEILSIIIINSAFIGTWYDVEGKCGDKPKKQSYDYIGLSLTPRK